MSPGNATPQVLGLNHFVKTAEGQMLIQNHRLFCIGGKLYQGYQGTIPSVDDNSPTEKELANCVDVDGSIGQVHTRLRMKQQQRKYTKQQEVARRAAPQRKQELEELQLEEYRQRLGKPTEPEPMVETSTMQYDDPAPMPEPSEPVVYPGPVSEITEMREDLRSLTGAVNQLINLQLARQEAAAEPEPKRGPGRPRKKTTKKTKARRKKASTRRRSAGADQ